MKEYPVFIPHEGEYLAAVVTVPDGEPRGLVLLMTGLGATRSHRFRIWTSAARRLAVEHQLASIRQDYKSIGDSTGSIREWWVSDEWVTQTVAIAQFGIRATGVKAVAAAGNCVGSWAALGLAGALPECVGAACIRMPMMALGSRSRLTWRARRWKWIADIVRSNAFLRSVVLDRAGRIRGRAAPLVRHWFPLALERARLLFLYGEDDFTYDRKIRKTLAALAAPLSPEHRHRYEVMVLPGRRLQGFESIESQEIVVDRIVEWMAGCFPDGASENSAVERSEPVRTRGAS